MDKLDVMELAGKMGRLWPNVETWPEGTRLIAEGLLFDYDSIRVTEAVLAIYVTSPRYMPNPGEILQKLIEFEQPTETWADVWLEILRAGDQRKPEVVGWYARGADPDDPCAERGENTYYVAVPWNEIEWSEVASAFLAYVGMECLRDLAPGSETPTSVVEGQLRRKWEMFVEKRRRAASYAALQGPARQFLLNGRQDVPALPAVRELAGRLRLVNGTSFKEKD